MERDQETIAGELVRAGAEAELHLLKRERKAERRLALARAALADDRVRVERSQKRMEKSVAAVSEAESALQACREQRALGPLAPVP